MDRLLLARRRRSDIVEKSYNAESWSLLNVNNIKYIKPLENLLRPINTCIKKWKGFSCL
jgi:hypothetical protein